MARYAVEFRRSQDLFTNGNLPDIEESLHEFAFPADDHFGETFEPFAGWHFRFGIEPVGKQAKLIS